MRTAPEYVDGDLFELTQEVLAKMRGDAAAVVNTSFIPVPDGIPEYAKAGIRNRHIERANAQTELRATIALWAGWHKGAGRKDSEIYRLFYLTYGMDIMGAQTLGATDATALREKLQTRLVSANVVPDQSCAY